MLASEIDYSPFGKDRDTIISPPVIKTTVTLITLLILTTLMILRDYGPTFTIHMVDKQRDQSVLCNMALKVTH